MANVECEYENSAALMEMEPNKRRRRSEILLHEAAECVSRGETFQSVSDLYNIPISTIR